MKYKANFWYSCLRTMKARVEVEADSLEEAKTIFESWFDNDSLFDHVVYEEEHGIHTDYDIDPVHDVEWLDENQ